MSTSTLAPSNSENTPLNVAQARLPSLTPEFVAKNYPSFLSVVQVLIVNRHGECAALKHTATGILPKNWNLCAQGNLAQAEFQKAVGLLAPSPDAPPGMQGQGQGQAPPWKPRMFEMAMRDTSGLARESGAAPASDGSRAPAATCECGQLTDLGRQSMTALGAYLRALYVDALGFLPPVPRRPASDSPTNDLYLRATRLTRSFESLLHVLGGLYPALEPGSPVFRVNVRPAEHETLMKNPGCKRLRPLFGEFKKKCLALHSDERRQLYADMRKVPALRKHLDSKGLLEDSRISTAMLDVAFSEYVHGMLPPDTVDDALLTRTLQLASAEHILPLWKSTAVARLRIGHLLREFAASVAAAVEMDRAGRDQQPKMAIYSAHDTTIAPLLATLGSDAESAKPAASLLPEMLWPPFGSSLRVELLKDAQSPYPPVRPAWEDDQKDCSEDASLIPFDRRIRPVNVPKSLYRWSHVTKDRAAEHNPRATRDYYVRIWYNDRALYLPACRDPGAHHTQLGSSVCTLDGFFKQTARFVSSEKEAVSECLV